MDRIEQLFRSELETRQKNGRKVFVNKKAHVIISFNKNWAVVLIEEEQSSKFDLIKGDTIIIKDLDLISLV